MKLPARSRSTRRSDPIGRRLRQRFGRGISRLVKGWRSDGVWSGTLVAGAALLIACNRDLTVSTAPSPAEMPPEVAIAAREAGGRNGIIELLQVRKGRGGPVIRTAATFRGLQGPSQTLGSPSSARGESQRPGMHASLARYFDSPAPFYTILPSGTHTPDLERLATGTDTVMMASFYASCYYGGRWNTMTDWIMDSIKVQSINDTGGHITSGHIGAKPKSVVEPLASRTRPDPTTGAFDFAYYADSTAGDEDLLFYYTVNDGNCPGPSTGDYLMAKRWPGFVKIPESDSLTYGTITSQHFDIFFARQAVSDATLNVVGIYRKARPNASLRLTAGNLIYGGLQDVNRNWRKPHNRHRIGTDVDLNAAPGGGGVDKLNDIMDACTRAGFERAQLESGLDHAHCFYFVGYTK